LGFSGKEYALREALIPLKQHLAGTNKNCPAHRQSVGLQFPEMAEGVGHFNTLNSHPPQVDGFLTVL